MTVAFSSGAVPVTNATLTAIKGGGTSENYRRDESGETPRWSGSEPVWFGEQLLTEQGRLLDQTSRAYVAVPQTLGITVKRGDTVSFTHGAEAKQRKVDDIREYDLVGFTRLYLTDE